MVQLLIGKLPIFDYLLDFLVGETEQDVLRFEVCVYDSANAVQEVESHGNLPCYFLDEVQRKALVVVAFQDFEEVYAQDLKNHTEVVAVGAAVEEGVE